METPIDRAIGELRAALAQEAPSDDKIIMDHVRKAVTILEEANVAPLQEARPDYAAQNADSLKRIADALDAAHLNGDVLANCIEGAIYRGLTSQPK